MTYERAERLQWERLELKKSWNPVAVLHTLCAFGNDFHNLGGGYIDIGVAEDEECPVLPPVGITQEEADRIQKELQNLGHSAIFPSYHPLAAPYVVDGKLVLVLWAPGGRNRAYRAKTSLAKDSTETAWFIRKNSSTVKAAGADLEELLSLTASVPLDDQENTRAKVSDLSRDLIVDYLNEVKSDLAKSAKKLPLEELGRRMGPPMSEPSRYERHARPTRRTSPRRLAGTPKAHRHAMKENGSPPHHLTARGKELRQRGDGVRPNRRAKRGAERKGRGS